MKLLRKKINQNCVLFALVFGFYSLSGSTDDHEYILDDQEYLEGSIPEISATDSTAKENEKSEPVSVQKAETKGTLESLAKEAIRKSTEAQKNAKLEQTEKQEFSAKQQEIPAQQEGEQVSLYVGDIKTLELGAIKRVAVGKGDIISTSILDNGHLLLLAEGEGDTKVRIWLKNGDVEDYRIFVQANDLARQAMEIRELVQSLPAVTQRRVGSRIILEGSVDEEGKAAIEIIKELYPDSLVDLTSQAQVGTQKMVYMSVQITEFNTSKLKSLGINWQNAFNGPSIAFATESVFEDTGQLSVTDNLPSGTSLSFSNTGEIDVSNDIYGYFGIASQITSSINLAKNNGDAIILAEPSLSARSGGEAEFLSGGEVPLPITSANGQSTVEFKEFGIKLKIKPLADDRGNITAEVETELSTVDNSLAVNGIPGFRTRKASTDVSLKDGQTLVISGLVNKEISDNVTGLAFFSDLPVLGPLFRSKDFRNAKSELVIFVTPHIIDEANVVNKKAVKHAEKIRQEFLTNIKRDASLLE